MEMYASSQLALIVGESLVNDISMKRLLTELRDGSIRETMSKEATVLYNTIQYNTTDREKSNGIGANSEHKGLRATTS